MSEYESHPEALHHYVSLFGSTEKFAWLERLLVDGHAYLRSPLDFNDPFDCLPSVVMPKTDVAWDLLGRRYREALREDFGSETADKMWDSYKRLSGSKRAQLLLDATKTTSAETGVFCFTEVIDSVLMWSHYADNHRGVCLTFDLTRPPPSDLVCAQPVVYSGVRPSIGALRKKGEANELYRALLRKADFWSYEREWRVLIAGGARTHLKFDPINITGITLGARCSPATEKRVCEIASKRTAPLRICKASVSEDRFDLVVSPI